MPSPGPDSQPEEMNSSQPSNASSSVPDIPSTPSAPTPTSAIPSVSVKIPKFFNLSSTPATLSLSGSLINGHPFSDHGGNEELVIYSGNAAECPRSFIIYLDLTGDMHGDKIKKQEEEENEEEKEKEEEREREESEEQGEEQEDGKGEEDRPYQQRQPIPYCIASRDSRSERHLQHLRVDATRSVFPWQPSTPSPLDQTPPGSPAELPIEAPVESKSGWPVEVRDSEDTDSSQPQTNDADLSYSTDPFSTITGAPRSIISTSLPNPEPKPSRPSSRLDLNNTSVGLYLCGSAMNGYPFSGRGQNDGFCIWSGPLADCPRAFNISLWLDDEWDEDDDDGDENRNQLPGTYCNIDKSDGGGPWYRIRRWIHDDDKRVRSLIIESMKPVWPWEPLTPLYTPRGSHSGWTPEPPPVGMKNGYTVGCWSNYPDGFWGTPPVGAPGGLRADSPVGYRSRPRAWST